MKFALVAGHIKNYVTNQSIAGVTITVSDSTETAISQYDGSFCLPIYQPNRNSRTVTFSKSGYSTKTITLLLEGNVNNTLKIQKILLNPV